jgi:hypothetical protein
MSCVDLSPFFLILPLKFSPILDLSGFHVHNALRTAHWDSLEKVLTVFILPSESTHMRVHRRLDLIFTAPEAYWTAVTGW